MQIGITGVQYFDKYETESWVEETIESRLKEQAQSLPLFGVTSLAVGSDQILARKILELGGSLHVVVPFAGYEKAFADQGGVREYHRLLDLAYAVETLPAKATDSGSFLAAGKRIVDLSDSVFAVWNGKRKPGEGYAPTTTIVVGYALERNKPVLQINHIAKHWSWLQDVS